jgi:hypothetical protein
LETYKSYKSDKEAVIEYLNGINAFLGPLPLEPAESKEVSQEEK